MFLRYKTLAERGFQENGKILATAVPVRMAIWHRFGNVGGRRADRGSPRRAEAGVRLRGLSRRAESRRRARAGRAIDAGGDADGRGQVADLSVARDNAARNLPRHFAADRADARPVARGAGERHPRRHPDERGRRPDGDDRRLPRGRAGLALCRARTGEPAAFPAVARFGAVGVVRGRRGALRIRMGPRFPPRLSPVASADGRVSARAPAARA